VKGREGCYGIVEMSGIKLMGSFHTLEMKEGSKVKMMGCGVMSDGIPYYFFEPIKG
jgi:hypothetical protein